MKKKCILLSLCVALIFSFSLVNNTSNIAEEEGPRPTSIINNSFI